MLFPPGTGGTINATTVEDRAVRLLLLAQTVDSNNYITAVLDTDTGFLKGTIELYGRLAVDANGFPEIRFTSAFNVPGFNSGTASGGASKASNLTEAIAEILQVQGIAERTEKNTTTSLYIESYSIALLTSDQNNINASLLVAFDLPCEITMVNGEAVISGKTYINNA